ncbi:MAG: 1,4-dihydroxy-2-naphthoate octaprenyltransferase [Clostridium sp.]|nr:1,4-dihydroxy-2-naphthoate octaprenyltransferase [Prevotella sp.]MCM1428304.1 1,4-dihydroxy-2-naphthoate octaprenyltransferase [Clostridium sp.]MCM1474776.1 1,4-dihydroxy-2-naphthoate octaprenyltransferase [Muribaculaceae bacterium]
MNGTRVKAWVEATRPRTLPVSIAGVIAGIACAIILDGFNLTPALICLLFALMAQIVSNFANEYYDFKGGLDKKGREGFRRGVTEGDITPRAMKRAMFLLLGADCLLGCSLIYWGGWMLLPVGILIALFALGYSTGPYPLSHHGLGDLAVVIFFGIVPVYFTTYVQTPQSILTGLCLPVGIATGLLAALVLIVNNYRDMEGDREVRKHTTVVIFGRKIMGVAYAVAFTVAIVLLWWVTSRYCSGWWGIGWAIIEVLYILLWKQMIPLRGKALNGMLKRTAILMLISCLYLLIVAL